MLSWYLNTRKTDLQSESGNDDGISSYVDHDKIDFMRHLLIRLLKV